MSDIVERLRNWAKNVRRNPSPISDALPMVVKAADEIERLREEVQRLSAVSAEPTFDGMSGFEYVANELYKFQEKTGCDTAEEFVTPSADAKDAALQYLIEVMHRVREDLIVGATDDLTLADRIGEAIDAAMQKGGA